MSDVVGTVKGGYSRLDQFQSYEKRADEAMLRLTLNEALVKAIDANGTGSRGCRWCSSASLPPRS